MGGMRKNGNDEVVQMVGIMLSAVKAGNMLKTRGYGQGHRREAPPRMFIREWGLYFKKYSFPKGPIPRHLESYTKTFTAAAGACRPVMTGLRGISRN